MDPWYVNYLYCESLLRAGTFTKPWKKKSRSTPKARIASALQKVGFVEVWKCQNHIFLNSSIWYYVTTCSTMFNVNIIHHAKKKRPSGIFQLAAQFSEASFALSPSWQHKRRCQLGTSALVMSAFLVEFQSSRNLQPKNFKPKKPNLWGGWERFSVAGLFYWAAPRHRLSTNNFYEIEVRILSEDELKHQTLLPKKIRKVTSIFSLHEWFFLNLKFLLWISQLPVVPG